MSETPKANMDKVAQKLATQIADLQYQLSQVEVIAETLKYERDAARNERDEARAAYAAQPVLADDVISGVVVEDGP